MKKIIAVLICMMLVCGSCCAEATFEFFTVEEKKPTMEFFRVPDEYDDQYVVMAALDDNGEVAASIELTCSPGFDPESSQFDVKVFELMSGKYYVEHSFLYEGISAGYMLIAYDAETGFTVETWVTDPGYSDAYGLYDGLTGEELLYGDYQDDRDPQAEIDEVLNKAFEGSSVRFEFGSWTEFEGLLLCALDRDGVLELSVLPGFEPAADVVATGNVNVRKGPGKTYEQLGTVNSGDRLEYLGETKADDEGTDWYRVAYGENAEAWISSKYSKLEYKDITLTENSDLEVVGVVHMNGDVNVRTGPGLAYDTLGVVKAGGELDFLGAISTDDRGVDWYRVAYGEHEEAWVSSRYTEVIY